MSGYDIERMTIVTPWFGEFAGGAEVAARSIAKALVRCGVEVEVLTTCCKSPYDNWWTDSLLPGKYEVNGVTVRRFSVNRLGKESYEQTVVKQATGMPLNEEEKYNFFTYGINSDQLIEFACSIELEQPILALPYFHGLTFSLVTSLPGRVSLMPCFHDEPQFYWEPVGDMLIHARDILYLSEEEKSLTIQNYGLLVGRKVVESIVVGVGIEIGLNGPMPGVGKNDFDDRTVAARYELPNNFFLYVGRKEAGKGVPELIEWYKTFLARQKAANADWVPLVFVGGGDASLVPKEKGFIDLGVVSEYDKYALLRLARGLINLSKNESFSLVIMEAWLWGIPTIVSSQCAVTRGHCRKSHGGLVVGNAEELCGALDLLASQPEIGRKLGQQGCNYVHKNYDWPSVLHRLAFAVS